MFVLDYVFKKTYKFIPMKVVCFLLAPHYSYTTFILYNLMIEDYCFPPNLYISLYYLSIALLPVSGVASILLWIGLFFKNKEILIVIYLMVQHFSMLYAAVVGFLLYATNYQDMDYCQPDFIIGGLSLGLFLWQTVVYICVNSFRVQLLEKKKITEDRTEPEEELKEI